MTQNFDFSDVTKVRKSLLVTSLIGIFYKYVVSHSEGFISFLGFKIPVKDANDISHLIGYLLIFFIIAFFIRLSKENLDKAYEEFEKYKNSVSTLIPSRSKKPTYMAKVEPKMPSGWRISLIKFFVKSLDLYFPVLLSTYVSVWVLFY
ncbi:hypothetical protein [uncultured Tenacibaculum sp.]|uniref:hypothetical protein n=1 Tax=uncultured Tenacibaculum sp. TaxID=174713 RepID=UPI002633B8A7|nr:hypothetical protein [uncultured Tenacibaculum sp.]